MHDYPYIHLILIVEKKAMTWIKSYVSDFSPPSGVDDVHAALEDGVVLCKLFNAVAGKANPIQFNEEGQMVFVKIERIGLFVDAITSYGVQQKYIFQTIDLYEKKNMWAVILGLRALADKAAEQGFRAFAD